MLPKCVTWRVARYPACCARTNWSCCCAADSCPCTAALLALTVLQAVVEINGLLLFCVTCRHGQRMMDMRKSAGQAVEPVCTVGDRAKVHPLMPQHTSVCEPSAPMTALQAQARPAAQYQPLQALYTWMRPPLLLATCTHQPPAVLAPTATTLAMQLSSSRYTTEEGL